MIKKIGGLSLGLLGFYFLLYFLMLQPYQLEKLNVPEVSTTTTLTIWGSDKSLDRAFAEYEKSNSEVNLKYTYIPEDQFKNRLKMYMTETGKLPDICIMDTEVLNEFMYLGVWENLEQPPYSLNREDLLDYSIQGVSDTSGAIIAVPYNVSASGVAFRKSLAQKVIGTDNPNSISIHFKSWADVLSRGSALKKEFGDDFYMFAGIQDPGIILFHQTSQAYVKDHVLQGPERFYNYFKVLIKMRDYGLLGEATQFSPQWYQSFQQENILFYPCSLGLPQQGVFGGKREGDWALTLPPMGSFEWQGSAWAIPKSSQNKEKAFQLIHEMLLTYAGAKYNKNKQDGIFIAYKPAYAVPEYRDLYYKDFGDQNIGMVYFNQLLPNIHKYEKTKHTSSIKKIYLETLDAIMFYKDMDAEGAYQYFLNKIENELPEVILDVARET